MQADSQPSSLATTASTVQKPLSEPRPLTQQELHFVAGGQTKCMACNLR